MKQILKEYHDYITAYGEEGITKEAKRPVLFMPESLGGDDSEEKRVYLTRDAWLEAQSILLSCLARLDVKKPLKRQAAHIMKRVQKGEGKDLRRECKKILGQRVGPFTIYHHDGRSVTAEDWEELETLTGLSYNKARDIATGLRKFYGGWSASKARAEKGWTKRGPKPKDIFNSEITFLDF